jgi:signal transduction histidine kinase
LPPPRPAELTTTVVAHFHRGGHWYVAAPVRPPGEAPLVLVGTSNLGNWTSPLRPLAALFAVMMLVGLAVRPLARRIVRPIERLIVASRRFGEGDLTTRVQLPRWRHHARHHNHPWARWHRRHHTDELFTLMHAWNDMAERIERQVGAQRELLANVSHELRSPLARVRVALALLPEEESTRQRIADIEADLGELDGLIEDILQTSRLEATGLPNHTERVELRALFGEVLARAAADPVTASLDVALVEHDPVISVEVDRALLRRALFNLVENAAKYGAPPVQLGVEVRDQELALFVRDRGPGVPPDERERVVRPFSRGDRAHTPGRGGVGLGLSFAARVAAVHGGRLELDDAEPSGLVVRLILPASRRT